MSRVITFSRFFPKSHPKAGEPTYFVEKMIKGLPIGFEYSIYTNLTRQMKDGSWQCSHLWRDKMLDDSFTPKLHTIRSGNRWKAGDVFSPRVWSGKPYASKQIQFAPDITIEKVLHFGVRDKGNGVKSFYSNEIESVEKIISKVSSNDGLSVEDFCYWFPKPFEGQIIIWDKNLNY